MDNVKYVFECLCEITKLGESVCVVGATKELGQWNPEESLELTTSLDRFPLWYSSPISVGNGCAEFKFIIRRRDGGVKWENCENRVLQQSQQHGNVLLIRCRFGFRDISLSTESVFATETDLSEEYSEHSVAERAVLAWAPPETPARPDIAHPFIEEAKTKSSYRERLHLVLESIKKSHDRESISLCVMLVKLIHQGYVFCPEDGRHFRPNIHATASRGITQVMFQSLQEQTLAASIFLREMLPMLPSFADSFTVAQPLTRIRDIAHRNDIPKEMKLRIKTQLQNKIHRCCDPADLGVCREILEELRLSSCNPSLVAEMEIFYSELKAFFNDVNLRELVESQSDCVSQETKTALLAPHSHCAVSVLAKLDVIRRARASLVSKIHNGESELQTRTQCLFLDLRLEQRAFALLSELDLLIENSESAVVALIRGLGCGIDHLRLTFPFDAELECIDKARAILNQNVVGNHDWLLVHCFARRLLNWHADVADIFLVLNDANLSLQPLVTNKRESALRLGEGCVRSHVVFQTSKFVSRVHRLACGRLGLPSVDVIAAGVREGCLLVHVDRVPASQLVSRVICEETSVDVVLLVNDLSGDEQVVGLDGEIGALLNTRVRVVGLIARQSIPALSHLGVRARQEGIVMVTVDWVEREAVRHVMSLVGQFISLDTTATDYSSLIKPAPFIAPTKRDRKARPHTQPSVDLVTWDVYFGKEISKELCGSKAHRCGQLERIADSAEFDAPKSLALPFSTIHILLNADPALKAEYNCLMEDLLTSQDNIRKATLAGRLQELITELRFPSDMASRVDSAVSRLLGDRELCMVRSSANVEDLKGESAAGLFSSMPAVKSTVHARILEVLASLYSSSAALSLSQIDKAHMAVLIQPLDASVEMSCIVHSKAPGVPESHVYAELAMGHGEVLASGSVKGTPHRLLIPRDPNEAVRVQSYSNLRCKAAVSDDGLLTWAPTTLQDDHFLQSARLRQ